MRGQQPEHLCLQECDTHRLMLQLSLTPSNPCKERRGEISSQQGQRDHQHAGQPPAGSRPPSYKVLKQNGYPTSFIGFCPAHIEDISLDEEEEAEKGHYVASMNKDIRHVCRKL